MVDDRRCSACGALVAADARWCGQCYGPLEPAPARAGVAAAHREVGLSPPPGPVRTPEGRPSWACPACGTPNPLELDRCSACNTPFARLFEEERAAPEIAPWTAALWSVGFPGLGQWKCGQPVDGIVRGIAFLFPFGMVLVMALSGLAHAGVGPTAILFLLLLAATVAVWASSMVDAYRVASGAHPLVTPRTLLWGLVGLIVVVLALASAVALPAVRHR
jgi:Double zinc ribbon